jgi:hypothetical protein
MPPAGFDNVIPGSSRPQAHDSYNAVTGIGTQNDIMNKITLFVLESINSSNSSISGTKEDIQHIWALENRMLLSDFNTEGSIAPLYGGDDKSLARPGRKQATATEDFDFHISYL